MYTMFMETLLHAVCDNHHIHKPHTSRHMQTLIGQYNNIIHMYVYTVCYVCTVKITIAQFSLNSLCNHQIFTGQFSI